MRWLGISSRAFEMLCQRANKRKIHNDGGTLADSEITQLYVAELAAELHGARLMTLSEPRPGLLKAWACQRRAMKWR